MKLKILVGSMTHTADHVAQVIQMECADLASAVEVEWMDGLDIHVFDAEKALEIYQSYNLRNTQMANSSMAFADAAFRRDRSRARSSAVA